MKRISVAMSVLGVCLLSARAVTAQQRVADADSIVLQARSAVDSGYASWNKDEMMRGYALLQRAAVIAPNDKYVRYYLSYAGYRLMTYGMATKAEDVYKNFADGTEIEALRMATDYPGWPEAKILLAAIYGIEIGHSWMKGPTLGPKSNDLVEEAIRMDSLDPRAYLILGAGKFSTPAIFGGSVEKAAEYFRKSVTLYENGRAPMNSLEPDWGYIDALTWLGLAYEKEGHDAEALAAYRKSLGVDPDYSRARYVLIPEVEKKLGSAK